VPFYVEFPTDPVVNVHWKKKDEPPPDPDGDPYGSCFPGTWKYEDSTETGIHLVIHDALTVEHNGIPGDRSFTSPPDNLSFFVVYASYVLFGRPRLGSEEFDPKNLYDRGLGGVGSKLLIEGSSTRSDGPPPVGPPYPKLPMFEVTEGGTTLSYSRMEAYPTMPVYPTEPFMVRGRSWSYLYNLTAPYYGGYPNFNPNAGGGPGVFYFTGENRVDMTAEYKGWYDYYYLGIGSEPGTVGDQFYNNLAGGTGTFHLALTHICGSPEIP